MRSEQRLIEIATGNPLIEPVLSHAQELGLPDCHLCAGCLTQSVWNQRFGFPYGHGIDDIDLIYFDSSDLSEAAEVDATRRARTLFGDLEFRLDVKNEARVHLWYESKFGIAIPPYSSLENAVASFPTTATSIALRKTDARYDVVAPYGLDDLFSGIVRPNKVLVTQASYEEKVVRWRRHWPNLVYLPWNDPD